MMKNTTEYKKHQSKETLRKYHFSRKDVAFKSDLKDNSTNLSPGLKWSRKISFTSTLYFQTNIIIIVNHI